MCEMKISRGASHPEDSTKWNWLSKDRVKMIGEVWLGQQMPCKYDIITECKTFLKY